MAERSWQTGWLGNRVLHEALSKCWILSLRWISPSAEAERRAVNYRETSAESMGQVFHKPNDP